MSELEEVIQRVVDERVEKALEKKLPEMIRALGISEVEQPSSDLIDATGVARMLGYDVSTEEAERRSRKRVYDLATRALLPCVRLSPKRIRFKPTDVKQLIDNGGYGERLSA